MTKLYLYRVYELDDNKLLDFGVLRAESIKEASQYLTESLTNHPEINQSVAVRIYPQQDTPKGFLKRDGDYTELIISGDVKKYIVTGYTTIEVETLVEASSQKEAMCIARERDVDICIHGTRNAGDELSSQNWVYRDAPNEVEPDFAEEYEDDDED